MALMQRGQYEAERCAVVGHAFLLANKPREAFSLFRRCLSRTDKACERWESCSQPDPAALATLGALRGKARVRACILSIKA